MTPDLFSASGAGRPDHTVATQGWVCGVDEAGRGPLAGPVCAAAVILDPARAIDGLRDSKKLSEARRDRLAAIIREQALAWACGWASVEEIDELNILQASLLAMRRAVEQLVPVPGLALVDGNVAPVLPCEVRTLVGGDAIEPSISAASILAKTARDALMMTLHARHPEYGFDRHKGYPSPVHLARLRDLGPCAAHRLSFAPVREALGRERAPAGASSSRIA